ncbi:hypothetical protein AVEN_261220-1 [Araneus ventricosus]|uniref:Uncharacterized protein n=1 Tax=Araneus ventricosus TaxID=182803 RepID=A0A4Y2V8H0_ARAVE|nr:hypothetical protein AVEN_261220-1 [Araneus ventricosus]
MFWGGCCHAIRPAEQRVVEYQQDAYAITTARRNWPQKTPSSPLPFDLRSFTDVSPTHVAAIATNQAIGTDSSSVTKRSTRNTLRFFCWFWKP